MKTREQELEALADELTKKRQEINAKYDVLAKLPDIGEYAPPSIHMYKLYGSVGSITYGIQRYSAIAEGKSPDVGLLRSLLEKLTPEPMIMLRGGCTSFQPEPDEYTNNGDITEIDPVTIEVNPSAYAPEVKIRWYTKLGGELWRVDVELGLHQPELGTLIIQYKTFTGSYDSTGERAISSCDFEPKANGRRIRWSTGDNSNKTPNHFMVYWERGRNVDVAGLLR